MTGLSLGKLQEHWKYALDRAADRKGSFSSDKFYLVFELYVLPIKTRIIDWTVFNPGIRCLGQLVASYLNDSLNAANSQKRMQ